MIERDDHILVRQCLEGDRRSFEELVDRYQKPIFNLALRMVSDAEDAADITQTVFVKVYESLRSFNSQYKFFSWLYRIAVNESLNFLRGRQELLGVSEELVSSESTADEKIVDEERDAGVQRALRQLTPDQRSAIVLRHFAELSYDEISEILGVPEKTVKSRLFEAREHLRKLLSGKGKRK